MDSAGGQRTWTHPDGRTIRLRPMEARALAYLRLHAGRLVSMKELLRNVWGYDSAARSRTVYTTIHRLRLAVEIDPHRPQLIVTVPGGGFRWAGGSGGAVPTPVTQRALPFQLDTFVDRPEVAAAAALLQAGHRLVTLTGISGIGKTRTALEVARRVADTFVGGAELVDLASCSSSESMYARIGRDLGLHLDTATGADAAARGFVARVGAIVVLDNVERVGSELARLLRATLRERCGAAFLVTARSALGVRGEQVVPVGALPLLRRTPTTMSPAGDLFLDRVGTVGLQLSADDVEGMVARLDGLPLAIEFAAARARAIPIEDLHAHLSSGFRDLRRPPGSEARHASLEAALDESWSSLDTSFRAAMTCLTVLGGSFPFALAEAVLPSETPAADTVQRLVECGMLQFDGRTYRLLTPVADFISRRAPASDLVWQRLDEFLANIPVVDIWERRILERDRLHAVAHLLPDAWVRAWKRGSAASARALLLRAYASNEWLGREGRETSELADHVIASAAPHERARIAIERANFWPREMLQQLGHAIEWAHTARDSHAEAYARTYRGALNGYRDAGDSDALESHESMAPALQVVLMTRRYHQIVAASAHSPEDRLSLIEAAVALGRVVLEPDLELHKDLMLAHVQALEHCGHYARALTVIEELERWLRQGSDVVTASIGASFRVEIRCTMGRLDRAETLVAELTNVARRSGSRYLMARAIGCAARVSAERHEYETALVLWREAIRELEQGGSVAERFAALRELARVQLHLGRTDLARTTLADPGFARVSAFVAFWRELMLLECDLYEGCDLVEESQVLDLVQRAAMRGAWASALARALCAWWLAGNGDAARSRAMLGAAWAALGAAQGLQHDAIARIAREVDITSVPRPGIRDGPREPSTRGRDQVQSDKKV